MNMADPIKLATGQPIDLSSPMTTLGGQLGQVLGGGLQQLAANRIQRLQQQQQVGSLANLLGGNQQLAADILSQPADIQKQIFASQGFANLMGGAQGIPQAAGMPDQAMGGLFTPAEKPLTAYQRGQQELAKQTLEQKQRLAESAEKRAVSKEKLLERKESEAFFEKNIKPDLESANKAKLDNVKLLNLRKISGDITTLDRLLDKLPEGFYSNLVNRFMSPAAVAAKKDTASFLRGIKQELGGRLNETEFNAWMSQYPDLLRQSPAASDRVIEALLNLNDFLIKKAELKLNLFDENPNITSSQLFKQLEERIQPFYNEFAGIKPVETAQTPQGEVVQPESSQALQQPVVEAPQPQQQLQAAPAPQVVEQPQATIQQRVEGLQNLDADTQFRVRELLREGYSEQEALDIIKGQDETTKQFVGATAGQAAQVVQPFITAFGNPLSKIFDNLGEGKIAQAAKIARKIIPTDAEAERYLKQLGVTQEQIDNPSALVKTLRAAGVAIPLGLATYAAPLATIASVALGAAGSQLGSFSLGKLGGLVSPEAEQIGQGVGELAGGILGSAKGQQYGKQLSNAISNNKAANSVLKTVNDKIESVKNLTAKQNLDLDKQIKNVVPTLNKQGKELSSAYNTIEPLLEANKNILIDNETRQGIFNELLNLADKEYAPAAKSKLMEYAKKYEPAKVGENPISVTEMVQDSKNLYQSALKSSNKKPFLEAREFIKEQGIEKFATPEYKEAVKPLNEQYRQYKNNLKEVSDIKAKLAVEKIQNKEKALTNLFQGAEKIQSDYAKAKGEAAYNIQDYLIDKFLPKPLKGVKFGAKAYKLSKAEAEKTKALMKLLETESPELLNQFITQSVEFALMPSKTNLAAMKALNEQINDVLFQQEKRERQPLKRMSFAQ
jgi:hypothetical protein